MKNLSERSRRALMTLRRRSLRPLPPLRLDENGALDASSHQALMEEFARRFFARSTVGGVVGLLRKGRLIGTFPYGKARMAPEQHVQPDTLFRVASVSKLVFTYAALALVEQGKLALDGDIGEVLGYAVRHPKYPNLPITLRQLLTHTASLTDAPQYAGPGIAGKLSLRHMLGTPEGSVNFAPWQPGTKFHYSNFGAGIVGSMMEYATGERFADVVTRLVFAPLGINGSFAPQSLRNQVGRVANGYLVRPLQKPRLAYDAERIIAGPLPPVEPERDFMAAPGRLVVDIAGLGRLLAFLCGDGEGVLRAESLAEMRTLQDGRGSVTGRCGRGLNVAFAPEGVLAEAAVVGHQGVAYGMNAEAWIDPLTQDGVVMATSGTRLGTARGFVRTGFSITSCGFAALEALRVNAQ